MAKQIHPEETQRYEPPHERNHYRVRFGWFVTPLLLLGLYGFFKSIIPVITWDRVMDLMNVQNKERYTMLAIWCLVLILLTFLWRIFRR